MGAGVPGKTYFENIFIAATQKSLFVKGAGRVHIPFMNRFFCDILD